MRNVFCAFFFGGMLTSEKDYHLLRNSSFAIINLSIDRLIISFVRIYISKKKKFWRQSGVVDANTLHQKIMCVH